MAIREILVAPDPRLKVKARPVDKVDDKIRRLMDDMLETMYAAPGIGLAAPQVGEPLRVIVVDIAREGEPPQPLKLANPELLWTSKEQVACEEGCLSVPDQFAEVIRPAEAKIRYLDYENEIREIHAKGLLAVCLQHEIDHLEGVLFVDHLSPLRRSMMLRKVQKARKTRAADRASA